MSVRRTSSLGFYWGVALAALACGTLACGTPSTGSDTGTSDLDAPATPDAGETCTADEWVTSPWTGHVGGASTLTGSCGGAGPERVVRFVAPSRGTYTFRVTSPGADTILYLRDTTCEGAELGCNDDAAPPATDSSVVAGLEPGQVVYAVVDTYAAGADADVSLAIELDATGCTAGETRPCPSGTSVGACEVGIQTCVGGAFGACTGAVTARVERCDGADDDCDGTVDDVASDACPVLAGATASMCRGGACVLTCAARRGDCNGDATDGCETDTARDDAHCGGCGRVCGAGEGCSPAGPTCLPVSLGFEVGTWADSTIEWRDVVTGPDRAYAVGLIRGPTTALGPSLAPVGSSDGRSDLLIAAFDATATLVWARVYGGTGTEEGERVGLDGAGNVYVSGSCRGDCTSGGATFRFDWWGAWVASYDAAGMPRWSTPLGTTTSHERTTAIAVDAAGTVWTAIGVDGSGLGISVRGESWHSYNAQVAELDAATGVVSRRGRIRDDIGPSAIEIAAIRAQGTNVWFAGTYRGSLLTDGRLAALGASDWFVVRLDAARMAQLARFGGASTSTARDRLRDLTFVGGDPLLAGYVADSTLPVGTISTRSTTRLSVVRLTPDTRDRVWAIERTTAVSGDSTAAAVAASGSSVFLQVDGEAGAARADGTAYGAFAGASSPMPREARMSTVGNLLFHMVDGSLRARRVL